MLQQIMKRVLGRQVGSHVCYIPGRVYYDGDDAVYVLNDAVCALERGSKYERSDDDRLYTEGTLERYGGGFRIVDTILGVSGTVVDLSKVHSYEYSEYDGTLIVYYVL